MKPGDLKSNWERQMSKCKIAYNCECVVVFIFYYINM